MSNLLKEAIVDAKALRDAALKTAESTIVEKYSDEVRKTLENILEQDDLGAALGGDMGLGPDLTDDPAAPAGAPADAPADEVAADVPFAAADDLDDNEGENLEGYEATSEDEPVDVEVDINLGALQEAINELQASMEDAENIEITEEDVAAAMADDEVEIVAEDAEEVVEEGDEDAETLEEDALDGGFPVAAEEEAETQEFNNGRGLGEDLDLDGLVDAITEKLTVDMGAELSGWAGRSNDDMHLEMEREMARRRSTDLQDNIETLKKAQEELVFENKKLQDELSQYKQATHELKENLQNVNLSNARLLYTNRVLRNTSLNERQKDRIVEAISSAGSVTEARTIFDTLQSTVEAKPKRSPQSLSEALVGRSSATVIRASRHESKPSDPIQERLKRLAGIK